MKAPPNPQEHFDQRWLKALRDAVNRTLALPPKLVTGEMTLSDRRELGRAVGWVMSLEMCARAASLPQDPTLPVQNPAPRTTSTH